MNSHVWNTTTLPHGVRLTTSVPNTGTQFNPQRSLEDLLITVKLDAVSEALEAAEYRLTPEIRYPLINHFFDASLHVPFELSCGCLYVDAELRRLRAFQQSASAAKRLMTRRKVKKQVEQLIKARGILLSCFEVGADFDGSQLRAVAEWPGATSKCTLHLERLADAVFERYLNFKGRSVKPSHHTKASAALARL